MRNIEVVELLLDKGAKVSAVDKVGRLPPGQELLLTASVCPSWDLTPFCAGRGAAGPV